MPSLAVVQHYHESLNPPHGGVLKDLCLPAAEALALKQRSATLPGWDLDERQLCDLELPLNGAFSPLESFLGRRDYTSVLDDMRLSDDSLWPIPIVLDVEVAFAALVAVGGEVALRNCEGVPLAVFSIDGIQPSIRCRKPIGIARHMAGIAAADAAGAFMPEVVRSDCEKKHRR
ncbi:MAG TPA: hypothetical protein PKC03_10985 [Dokdonella sp.]|nr:hypothetical protein [Dokdonella sp.]